MSIVCDGTFPEMSLDPSALIPAVHFFSRDTFVLHCDPISVRIRTGVILLIRISRFMHPPDRVPKISNAPALRLIPVQVW